MAIKYGRPIESRVRVAPVEGKRRPQAAEPLDLAIRPRRNRRSEWARRMVRENVLTTDDLIWPLFVAEGNRAPVASMPGVERLPVDDIVRAAERAARLTIPCIALFPYTDPKLRDDDGSEALNPDNLVCRAIRAIKKEVPEIGILCDVALDPFTSHGHDGLLREGVILNDETVAVLVQQAKQLDHRGGRELEVLLAVEPQALAGEADVQLQRVAHVAGKLVRLHGLAAGWARRRKGHGAGAVRPGLVEAPC